ncbi:MAG: hemolysin XhlA family protein [Brevibacillus sp.]|nr:hemolysin XhlA family protein [Brevibacillus sp.]
MDKHLEDRVRHLEVRQAMIEQRLDAAAQDMKEIKNTLTWLNRFVLGATIAAVLNLIFKM